MAKHNEVGKIGEDIASVWLHNNGYEILQRNYFKKYGEIDIVARETNKIHFIEVKTHSYETKHDLEHAVSHETYRPEENVHIHKQLRLMRVIEVWLIEQKYGGDWQIDILAIYLVPREKFAVTKLLSNVIFE
jgi:putative endonuclease